MKQKTRKAAAFLAVLALACATGCGALRRSERIVFVNEATTIDGEPRQVVKLTQGAAVEGAAYWDGQVWQIAPGQTQIPAGWLVVSPAILEDGANEAGEER